MFPEAKLAIGPPIEEGFYYDFDLPRALTQDDLAEIEKRMEEAHREAAGARSSARSMLGDEALEYFGAERSRPTRSS